MTASETDMQAEDVRALRQSAVPTALAGLVCVAVGAAVAGGKGALGALLALVVVTIFFAISLYVVGRAAKISPQAMMIAALSSYMVKIIALAAILSAFQGTTLFNGQVFGFSAIALVLVWSGTQVRAMVKSKILYVEPRP
jgi:ATP synthase protein I